MQIRGDSHAQVPYYWIVAGVLLIVAGTVLGFAAGQIYLVIGIGAGAAACARGYRILRQHQARDDASDAEDAGIDDEYSDQTCELNLSEVRRLDEFV